MPDKNILGLIGSMMEELPKAEKKAAQVILDNPEEIIHMKASDLGKKAQTSAATVIRLCKRLEVSSFTELKVFISREISASENSEELKYSDFKPDESLEDTIDKLLGNAYVAMKDTVSLLDENRIKKTVRILKDAEIIYVFGIGASSLVAQNIVHKWSRAGKICVSLADTHQMIAAMGVDDKRKVFIGISNKGETKEVIELMKLANENNYQTISITQFGNNTLSEMAELPVQHVRANEAEIRSAATSSLHAQFLVIDILFFYYSSQDYNAVLERVLKSREQIKNYNQ